ncbi:MAG TPA: hypothetical protein VFT50_09385 [Baekduia sp.]|nr:hypothetical protein [Baekduia sp.]
MSLPSPTVADPAAQQNFDWLAGHLVVGRGSPEGVVRATPGSLYVDEDGGAGATLYVKESGNGDTGWVAK